jgi:bisphosphoglycerate-dependent phosphoglycerate mutase
MENPTGVLLVSISTRIQTPRAIKTAWLAVAGMGKEYLPETRAWQLNERMYGLAGLTPQEAYAKCVCTITG